MSLCVSKVWHLSVGYVDRGVCKAKEVYPERERKQASIHGSMIVPIFFLLLVAEGDSAIFQMLAYGGLLVELVFLTAGNHMITHSCRSSVQKEFLLDFLIILQTFDLFVLD